MGRNILFDSIRYALDEAKIAATITTLHEDFSKLIFTPKYSEGLSFYSRGNGTCDLTHRGACTDTDIIIPRTSPKGDVVTRINAEAFYECSNITSVVIPDSVVEIDLSVFQGCSSLTSIEIPDSVTSIGSYTFSDCTSLTSITIPDGVMSIGDGAFYSCSSLTSIVIPSNIISFEYQAFYGCTSLINIEFKGTISQWNNLSKGYNWNRDIPATQVQCSDGVINL